MASVKLLLIALHMLLASAADTWDYSGSNWTVNYPVCGGSRQSPINIDSDTLVMADFSDFSFSIGYKIVQTGPLENNGHTVKFTVDESRGARISGGPLNESYTLTQFHLHWGSQQDQGAEHTVDGHSYDGELHLVHYKSSYDNISAAVHDGQADSLSVVGIFLREESEWDQHRGHPDSGTLSNLRAAAKQLSRPYRGPGQASIDVEILPDELLCGITDLSGFYHYEGSLTTPGCAEIVQWIVMDTPMYIRSNGLIAALKKNVDINGDEIQDNYRPTQALNNRTVYHYVAGSGYEEPEAPCASNCTMDSDCCSGFACDNTTMMCAEICECDTIHIHGGGGARSSQPQIFTSYTKESGFVNGHSHYTSLDGNSAIAFNTDHNEWKIQPDANRGSNIANAQDEQSANVSNVLHACPTDVEIWHYWDGSEFTAAGDDLNMDCAVDETCGCNTIEIVASSPASIPSAQAGIYTTYTIEPDLLNFRSHYTSQDGNKVIAFNMDHNEWKIQPLANRGTTIAYAANLNDDNAEVVCPSDVDDWEYWSGSEWLAGGADLVLNCLD